MKKYKNIIIFIVSLVSTQGFICNQAFAGEYVGYVFEQINNSFAIGLAGLNVDYKDTSNAPEFQTAEVGKILGFSLDKRITFFRRIYTDFYFDLYSGRLKYRGLNKFTSSSTCDTKSMFLFNANVKAGYVFNVTGDDLSLQAIPYLGYGYNRWDKSCRWGIFKHNKAIAGIKLDLLLTNDCVLSPYFEGGKISNAELRVSRDLSLALGNEHIYSVGLELNYKMLPATFLNGFIDFTHFTYGESEAKYGRYEPSSRTNEVKVGLGLRWG